MHEVYRDLFEYYLDSPKQIKMMRYNVAKEDKLNGNIGKC